MTYPVPESLEAGLSGVQKVRADFLLGPAPDLFLQHQRQIPVVQRHTRRDAIGQQAVNHFVVVGHAQRVDVTRHGVRDDARPRDGLTIGIHLQKQQHTHSASVRQTIGIHLQKKTQKKTTCTVHQFDRRRVFTCKKHMYNASV